MCNATRFFIKTPQNRIRSPFPFKKSRESCFLFSISIESSEIIDYICSTKTKCMENTHSSPATIAKQVLLTLDIVVQASLLAMSLFLPLIFFTSVLLGGWQLSSSLLKGVLWNSRLHALYFASASAYSSLLYFFSKNSEKLPYYESSDILSGLWYVVLLPPLVGAIWYFVQSIRDFKLRV
jgi:hypothetical protein